MGGRAASAAAVRCFGAIELQPVVQHLKRLAEGGAVGGDSWRPHQPVEVRVLAHELEVVVPAGTDVVGDVLVDDRCGGPLRLEERGPAEVDNGGEEPFLVA